jgi:maltooligosyltrehalose synthase
MLALTQDIVLCTLSSSLVANVARLTRKEYDVIFEGESIWIYPLHDNRTRRVVDFQRQAAKLGSICR